MYHLPNIDSSTFTLSVIIVGFMLIDDLNWAEQNTLGNCSILVGQTLETSGRQLLLTKLKKTIDMLTKTIAVMQKEIDN